MQLEKKGANSELNHTCQRIELRKEAYKRSGGIQREGSSSALDSMCAFAFHMSPANEAFPYAPFLTISWKIIIFETKNTLQINTLGEKSL
jgi:hypothetical protein